jgi:hypothetical protein
VVTIREDGGLGDGPQVAQELLRGILRQVHAGDLDRPVQRLCSPHALGTAKVRRYGRVDAVEIVEITCLWCARSPPTSTGRCTRSGT